ncbi:ArsR/SmtB family transcription factor [Desulfobacula sp.]|uniref:ArsR/SmtB family transcription factor n=1 Tax=Desulfobacula sp. TaxID=2593537 RepID=UPI0039B8D085|nr:winged helix-turn-helix transcriptional regulator [Desulfobacula sp.]
MDKPLLILKSISDKNRLRIFSALLVHDELCACQITEFLKVAGATASRHLSLMVSAGALKNRKQGRWIYFRLNKEDDSIQQLSTWVKQNLAGSSQARKNLNALKEILLIPCEKLSQRQRESGSCSET